uniref:Splicing factor 45 n=1 Tax=Phallusia mammillata TaxID=59560 RepID=A0A6F9DPV0_9ASCI|nr:splicing factor 45-like [Phallusia mammillata]
MSLYDGLGVDNNQDKAVGWSPSFAMLKTQLQAKKATLAKAKSEKTRQPSTIAPVIDFNKLRRDEASVLLQQEIVEPKPCVFLGGEVLEKFLDEYDPMRPNDYDKMAKKKREADDELSEKDREKEIEERRKRRAARHAQSVESQKESLLPPPIEDEYDDTYEQEKRKRSMPNKAAIAPPSALLESDKQSIPTGLPPVSDRPSSPSLRGGAGVQFASNLAGSVAHKIMAKYGFKEGRGLGKDNKGMSHALQVEKTSKRGGKIISSDQIEQQIEDDFRREQQEQKSVTDLLKNPTKVICLRNMVGPGEVDDDLEGETSEECSKYGTVNKCIIFEMHGVNDEEAIRIFIEFDRMEAAIKALVDLNGRFFGGRTVKASFYDVEKFKSFQLSELIT